MELREKIIVDHCIFEHFQDDSIVECCNNKDSLQIVNDIRVICNKHDDYCNNCELAIVSENGYNKCVCDKF